MQQQLHRRGRQHRRRADAGIAGDAVEHGGADGRQVVDALAQRRHADADDVATQAFHSIAGFGPLQPLLDDPTVEEVWINAPGRVFAARDGRSELTTVVLDDAQVRAAEEKLVDAKSVDAASHKLRLTEAGHVQAQPDLILAARLLEVHGQVVEVGGAQQRERAQVDARLALALGLCCSGLYCRGLCRARSGSERKGALGWAGAGRSSSAARAGTPSRSTCSKKNAHWPARRASCLSAR